MSIGSNRARIKFILISSAISFVFVLAWGAHAQSPEPTGEVLQRSKSISGEIYSPFCPGKTLAMCPSPRAAEVRRDIQDLVASGLQTEEVKARILQQYGQEFRVVEPPTSDNVLLFSVVLFGLFIAAVVTRRISSQSGLQEAPAPLADETADTQLAELRELYRD